MEELRSLLFELTSGDDERANRAVSRIAVHGVEGFEVIQPLLTDPEPDHRWWAVRTLAEFPDRRAIPPLILALKDEDQSVRQCAAQALFQRPDERAVPALISSIGDDDSLVARLSANALVAVGEAAVPALLEILREESATHRLEAIRALAMIGDQRAIPALFDSLDEDSALMEYWANEGLEKMGVGMMFFNP